MCRAHDSDNLQLIRNLLYIISTICWWGTLSWCQISSSHWPRPPWCPSALTVPDSRYPALSSRRSKRFASRCMSFKDTTNCRSSQKVNVYCTYHIDFSLWQNTSTGFCQDAGRIWLQYFWPNSQHQVATELVQWKIFSQTPARCQEWPCLGAWASQLHSTP